MSSFKTLDRLLGHVIEVEMEMIALSAESHRRISEWMKCSTGSISDEVLEVMQYQDILSQQLNATCEAMRKIREHLCEDHDLSNENVFVILNTMDERMVEILENAQNKHLAFGGKLHHDNDEGIDFF